MIRFQKKKSEAFEVEHLSEKIVHLAYSFLDTRSIAATNVFDGFGVHSSFLRSQIGYII